MLRGHLHLYALCVSVCVCYYTPGVKEVLDWFAPYRPAEHQTAAQHAPGTLEELLKIHSATKI